MEAKDYDKIFGLVIKSIREYLGHSTKQLSDALMISEEDYREIERGHSTIAIGQVHAMTTIMGFSILYLFSIVDVFIKFEINKISEGEIEAKSKEIWFEVDEKVGPDKEGFEFFKTNLTPLLLQIKKTNS